VSVARRSCDVVIVGAGIAGCTAATLYGRRGLSVALIDRRSRIEDYKRMCTHFIQPSATPVIERLGLARAIEDAGGVRNALDTWTRWGWIRAPAPAAGGANPYGYSIRRQTLDPMLRGLAAGTPGVDLMLGQSALRLTSSGRRFTGVVIRGRDGRETELAARLVVAADGRSSELGDLAGVKARVRPNTRFTYFAYYRNLVQASGETGQMWVLEPETAIAYPNDDGLRLVACFVPRSRLAEFKRDPDQSFERLIGSLPEGPDIASAERVSPLLGKLEMPNSSRRTAVPGLAFVGDAAMTGDPLWAIGCGWAFESASWLVDATAEALRADGGVDRALRRYRRKHRSELLAFYLQSSNFSTRGTLLPHEKLILASAAMDPVTARRFTGFGEGLVSLGELLSPRSLGRALRVVMAGFVGNSTLRTGS
jgi:2-polyprenyl-6-methoxyphenol hydroxylase-like FAD-dependent oxidoreductase